LLASHLISYLTMPRTPKLASTRDRKKALAMPVADSGDNIGFIPALDSLHLSMPFSRSGGIWQLTDDATALDFYYAIDPRAAPFCIGVTINGKPAPLSTVPEEADLLDFYVSEQRSPSQAWIAFTKSPARELITHALGLPLSPIQQTVFDIATKTAAEQHSIRQKPATPQPSAAATQATGYLQPGRAGKKLIGAYIDKADAARLKSLLAAQGVTVQEFFAEAVTKALTADTSPAQRERLIEAQVERFRANLRANLK
jgi:hypothetical protein